MGNVFFQQKMFLQDIFLLVFIEELVIYMLFIDF